MVVARTSEGVALFRVELTDGNCELKTTVDSTRRMARLTLNGAEASLLVELESGRPV